MTLDHFVPASHGHYTVYITHRGERHASTTSNMNAIDRVKKESMIPPKAVHCGYTLRQAERALCAEAKRKLNLK